MAEEKRTEHTQTTVFFRLDPTLARFLDVIAAALEGDDVEAASTALAVGVHEMLRRLHQDQAAEQVRAYMHELHPGQEVVWGVAIDRSRENGG